MKKTFTAFLTACCLVSCISSTKITGAWKNQKQPAKTYSSIFVASLSANNVARATVEKDLASALEKQGITAYKSMDEFPPEIKKDSLTNEDLLGKILNIKADAILTVSLIRKETESRYV